jgi:hypothetical protein
VNESCLKEVLAYPIQSPMPTPSPKQVFHPVSVPLPSCLRRYMTFVTVEPSDKFHENHSMANFVPMERLCSTVEL